MDSIKSRPKENNGYNLEENWSSESKYKDANEDFENNKNYNAYRVNNKEESKQWWSEIDFISKQFEENLKIDEPNTQPPKAKRKPRDLSIEKKDLQKEKNKRVKKGTTVGERKHELKIIVTDYGERNDSEIKIWDCTMSDEDELNYENLTTNVKDGECTKIPKEECDKDKMLIKLFKKYSPYKISKDKLVDYHKATIYRKYEKYKITGVLGNLSGQGRKKENESRNWRIYNIMHWRKSLHHQWSNFKKKLLKILKLSFLKHLFTQYLKCTTIHGVRQ